MISKVKAIAYTMICLVTFLVIAPQIVGDFHSWECACSHEECEWCFDIDGEWHEFEYLAYREAEDSFTALFNSYETKRAKNGRLMIRQGEAGSFKFAKK